MRILLEVLGGGADQANFPIKNGNGKTESVPFFWISGVDADYLDQIIKLKVYRPRNIEKLKKCSRKGNQLQVKFKNLRPPSKFENCVTITVHENDIQLHGTNGTAVEMKSESEMVTQ